MPRRLIGSVVGALAAASLVAPVAHAGSPAKVSVRAEAPTKTLVETTLTTTTTPVVKDGDSTHSCTGTSAAGALELATGGNWSGSWFNGLGYAVDAIAGVKGPADFSAYWTLWVDGKSSPTGVCGTELNPGDEVLEFLCTSTPDFSSCTNLPLALVAPKGRVRPGKPVAIHVMRLKGDGTSEPAAGAVVRGGSKPVTADAGGIAHVVLGEGQFALRATRTGDVISATLHCAVSAKRGACGSADRTPPTLKVKGIRSGELFAPAKAPRVLRGVARDPEGVTVALRIVRHVGKRCWIYDAKKGAFRHCGRKLAAPFAVGDRPRWSYLLPSRLAEGAYTLDVRATDKAGNATKARIRFAVGVAA